MREYFYQKFPIQLATIKLNRPSEIIRDFMHDESVVFFGGRDWCNVQADLDLIPVADRSKFVLSLFTIVLIDQTMFTHFRGSYDKWRTQTNYPKFGWSGLGPHNENPFKILWAPERDGLIDVDQTIALVDELLKFLVDDTSYGLTNNRPRIEFAEYFKIIRNDDCYSFNLGRIIPEIKVRFETLINN